MVGKSEYDALLRALRQVESAALHAATRDPEWAADAGRLADLAARRHRMLDNGPTPQQSRVRSLGLFRFASEIPRLFSDQELIARIKEAESLWKTTVVDRGDQT